MNFLSSIANLSYSGGKTSLRFHSILANTAVVLKLRNSANICSAIENLNLFIERINEDNDNDYIGYFDSGDINAALFRSEFEESSNIYPRKFFSLKLEGFLGLLGALGIFSLGNRWGKWIMVSRGTIRG